MLSANGDEDLLMLSKKGQAIRIPVADIRVSSRATAGVKLMNLTEGDEVASAFVIEREG